MEEVLLVVGEGLPRPGIEHLFARCGGDRVGCSGVPFHRRSEARVDIRRALRQYSRSVRRLSRVLGKRSADDNEDNILDEDEVMSSQEWFLQVITDWLIIPEIFGEKRKSFCSENFPLSRNFT